MEAASRTRLVALAVLLAVAVPLVIVAVSSSGDAGEELPAGLRVEQTAGGLPEITVYVEDRAMNDSDTAGGAASVVVECEDRSGEIVFSEEQPWPFSDTDAGTVDPHAHIGMNQELVKRIARCRLRGTDPPLEGRRL